MQCHLHAPTPTCTRLLEGERQGTPTPASGARSGKGRAESRGWQSAVPAPLLPAGVTGILAMELFDQTARPAAYMVCGALMWTMLFLVGLGFPFILVGLPLPLRSLP